MMIACQSSGTARPSILLKTLVHSNNDGSSTDQILTFQPRKSPETGGISCDKPRQIGKTDSMLPLDKPCTLFFSGFSKIQGVPLC